MSQTASYAIINKESIKLTRKIKEAETWLVITGSVAVRTKKIEGWEIQWKYYIRVPVVTEAQ